MYAHYEPQLYDITFSGDKVSFNANPLKVPYTKSSQITLTPASGYYFESISCSAGYTVSGFASGTAHYSTQTITITNNTYAGGGTCMVKMHSRSYPATPKYHVHTGSNSSGGGCYTKYTSGGYITISVEYWLYDSDLNSDKPQSEHNTYFMADCPYCGKVYAFGASSLHDYKSTVEHYCPHLSHYELGCGKTEGVTIDSYTCPNGGSPQGSMCVFS
ncbi:MAG: hypothetical protein J5982_06355 [Bacilli bacterium]|nr:hypothetical protein [Bacilli bacterium]